MAATLVPPQLDFINGRFVPAKTNPDMMAVRNLYNAVHERDTLVRNEKRSYFQLRDQLQKANGISPKADEQMYRPAKYTKTNSYASSNAAFLEESKAFVDRVKSGQSILGKPTVAAAPAAPAKVSSMGSSLGGALGTGLLVVSTISAYNQYKNYHPEPEIAKLPVAYNHFKRSRKDQKFNNIVLNARASVGSIAKNFLGAGGMAVGGILGGSLGGIAGGVAGDTAGKNVATQKELESGATNAEKNMIRSNKFKNTQKFVSGSSAIIAGALTLNPFYIVKGALEIAEGVKMKKYLGQRKKVPINTPAPAEVKNVPNQTTVTEKPVVQAPKKNPYFVPGTENYYLK